MNIDARKKDLFRSDSRLYAVLDGASVPDLPMKLFKTGARNYCLIPGELDADTAYVAPYLVHLPENDEFTNWVLNDSPGAHWGIFAQSRSSILEMRGHFRGLLNVYDEDANSLTFRYYDPRVLRKFLPTCNPGELKIFFGKVDAFFAEDSGGEKMFSFRIENGSLRQSESV